MRGDDDRDPIMIPRRWILGPPLPARPADRDRPSAVVCENASCRAENRPGRHVIRLRDDGFAFCTDCGGIFTPGIPGIRGAFLRPLVRRIVRVVGLVLAVGSAVAGVRLLP